MISVQEADMNNYILFEDINPPYVESTDLEITSV